MMYFSRVRLKSDIWRSPNLTRLIQGDGYAGHQLLWELFPDQRQRPFIFREEIAKEQTGYRSGSKGEPIYYLISEKPPLGETAFFMTESRIYAPNIKSGDRLAFRLRANPVVARKKAGKKNSGRHDIVMDAQRNLLTELEKELGLACRGKKSELRQRILTAWETSPHETVEEKMRAILGDNERFADLNRQTHLPDRLLYWATRAFVDKSLENWLSNKGNKNGFQLHRSDKDGLIRFQAEGYRWHPLPRKGRNAGFSTVDFEGVLEVCNAVTFIESLFKGIGPAKGFGCGLMLVRRA